MCFFVKDEGSRSNHRIRPCEQAPRCEFSRLSRRSEGGIAPVSGTGDRGFESRRFDQRIRIVFYGSPFSYFRGTRTKVLRRLASIVVARRSPLSPSTPCFARARRQKQLSIVLCLAYPPLRPDKALRAFFKAFFFAYCNSKIEG